MLPRHAVCFVCIGATIGKICMTVERSLTNQQINSVVVDTTRHDPFFVYYLLSTYASKVKGLAGGAATPIVSKSIFEDIEAVAPHLPIQRKIAAILSAYDDLIENNERRIQILEEMAQNLYREWFVKFRFPLLRSDGSYAGQAGHGNVKMVDSPLGKIPERWEVKNLFDVADVTFGFPFNSRFFTSEPCGLPVIRIRNILDDSTGTFTAEKADDKYLIEDGDILIGMDGDFHMGRWAGGKAWLNQRITRLRPKTFSRYLLFIAVRKPIQQFNATIVGTTVAHLGKSHLERIEVIVPPLPMLAVMNERFDDIFWLEINLKRRNRVLRQTRDLLLPRLISGELDVAELEIKIPEDAK